jgi:hypothetical protein
MRRLKARGLRPRSRLLDLFGRERVDADAATEKSTAIEGLPFRDLSRVAEVIPEREAFLAPSCVLDRIVEMAYASAYAR